LLHYLEPAYVRNPIDFGGANGSGGEKDTMAGAVAKIVAADENVAALFVALNTSRPYTEICRSIGDALAAQRKPFILLFTPGSVGDAARAYFQEKNCPYFNSLDSAIRVLAALVDYASFLQRNPAAASASGIPLRAEG
jgi:acyl-CoA synthetase (NDP forming)